MDVRVTGQLTYLVQSESKPQHWYTVAREMGTRELKCSCPDASIRGNAYCKHTRRVRSYWVENGYPDVEEETTCVPDQLRNKANELRNMAETLDNLADSMGTMVAVEDVMRVVREKFMG